MTIVESQSKGWVERWELCFIAELSPLLWYKATIAAADAPNPLLSLLSVPILSTKLLLDMWEDLTLVQAVVEYLFVSHVFFVLFFPETKLCSLRGKSFTCSFTREENILCCISVLNLFHVLHLETGEKSDWTVKLPEKMTKEIKAEQNNWSNRWLLFHSLTVKFW